MPNNEEKKAVPWRPLYSLPPPEALFLSPDDAKEIDPNLFEKAMDNIVIDPVSLDLLEKAPDGQRFAVIGIIRKIGKEEKPKIELFFRPGFDSARTQEELKKAAQQFGDEAKYRPYFVQSVMGRPGVVHGEVISQIISDHPKLGNPKKAYIDDAKAFTLGFSVLKTADSFQWINRSTQNHLFFSKDSLALACFAFSNEVVEASSTWKLLALGRRWDNFFHIDRSIPLDFFQQLTTKTVEQLNKTMHPARKSIVDPNSCFSSKSEDAWKELGKLPEIERQATIQTFLFNNVYIHLLDYGSTTDSRLRENILIQGFEDAKKNNISLDFEYIPKDFTQNAMVFAASKGKVNLVKYFLAQTNATNREKNLKDALDEALAGRHLNATQFLLEELNALPAPHSKELKTARDNALHLFQTLDDPDADLLSYLKLDKYHEPIVEILLTEAIQTEQFKKVELLVQHVSPDFKKEMLREAIQNKNSAIILLFTRPAPELTEEASRQRQLLLDFGLMTAVKTGDNEVVKLFIAAGANVNTQDKDITPLFDAVRLNHRDIIKTLIEAKAEAFAATALLRFSAENNNPTVFLELCRLGADPLKRETDGNTALDIAAKTFSPTQFKHVLDVLKIDLINPESFRKLVSPFKTKEEKSPLHIYYDNLKEMFLDHVKTLPPPESQSLMEKMIRGETELGIILRNEPQPTIYNFPHPSYVPNLLNPSLVRLAAETGNTNFLKFLLPHIPPAEVNLRSLLTLTANNGHFSATQFLFDRLENTGVPDRNIINSCLFLKYFDDPNTDLSPYFSSEAEASFGEYQEVLFSLALRESINRGQIERAQLLLSCPMLDSLKKETSVTFISKLINPIEPSEEKLALPEKINYEVIKNAFLEYANTLTPKEVQSLWEKIIRSENTLGLILRNEPRPMTDTFQHPSTLQQIYEEMTRRANLPDNARNQSGMNRNHDRL